MCTGISLEGDERQVNSKTKIDIYNAIINTIMTYGAEVCGYEETDEGMVQSGSSLKDCSGYPLTLQTTS